MREGTEHWLAVRPAITKPDVPVVLEPGACHGQQTALMASVMKGGRLWAIEPDPRNIIRLRGRSFPECVTIIEGAISDHTGEAEFHQSTGIYPGGKWKDWSASGSCRKPAKCLEHHPWLKFKLAIRVPCWTLDDFCLDHSINHIDLIHADIQGCERDLIELGQQMLRHTRYMNLEVSEGGGSYEGSWTMQQMIEHLPNWEMVKQFGPDVLFRNTAYEPGGP